MSVIIKCPRCGRRAIVSGPGGPKPLEPHYLRDGTLCGLGDPGEVIGKNRQRAARFEAALVYQRAQEAMKPAVTSSVSTSATVRLSTGRTRKPKQKQKPSLQEKKPVKAEAPARRRRREQWEAKRPMKLHETQQHSRRAKAETEAQQLAWAKRELEQLKRKRAAERRGGPWIRIVSGGGGPGSGKRS